MASHAPPSPEKARLVVRRSREDAVWWLRNVASKLANPVQARILRSLAKHRIVAVPSCHGSGKTWVAAVASVHNLVCFGKSISVTTAPGERQVKQGVWKEIRTLVSDTPILRSGPKPNLLSWEITPDWYGLGFTAPEHDADRFRGIHSPKRVLIVVDEAHAVSEEIYTGVKGALMGPHPRALYLGHPLFPTGEFADVIEGRRSGADVIRITAFDTPNLLNPGITIEDIRSGAWEKKWAAYAPPEHETGLVDPVWVRERWEEWCGADESGESSPKWSALVMARVPDQVEERVFARSLVEEAAEKEPVDHGGEVEAGVDPAGPGKDETAWCIRSGDSVLTEGASQKPDARGDVMRALHPYKERMKVVRVDAQGEGRAFARHLQDFRFPVYEAAFGANPQGQNDADTTDLMEEYRDLKAQIHWTLRKRMIEGRCRGFRDEYANRQMTAIGWGVDSQGRIVIESKESIQKREAFSPDRAEARCLAFATMTPGSGFFWA